MTASACARAGAIYAAQLVVERAAQRTAGRTADHREGIAAFLQHRPAAFSAPTSPDGPQ